MIYSRAVILALAMQCAPNVAPQTVAAIVLTESRGEEFALNVNGAAQHRVPATADEAAATARRYIAAGYSVDLGLGQINSRNIHKLGLTWDIVFDPCTNIAALGRVITGNYEAALVGREPQTALRIAFSLYNTGSPSRGFRNGYVDRVVGNAGLSARANPGPAFSPFGVEDGRLAMVAENTTVAAPTAATDAMPPNWNVFMRAAYARRTAPPSTSIRSRSVWSE